LFDNFVVGGLQPSRCSAAVRDGRARDTFSVREKYKLKERHSRKKGKEEEELGKEKEERVKQKQTHCCACAPWLQCFDERKREEKRKKRPRFSRKCQLISYLRI
jgi:hypothetical protein